MRERPILFSAPMVRAILDGRKTQNRRFVKIPSIVRSEDGDNDLTSIDWCPNHESGPSWCAWMTEYPEEGSVPLKCPYGIPGDRLWVREAFSYEEGDEIPESVLFQASHQHLADELEAKQGIIVNWRPSIHMPRWASRITLEIVDVRVEHLQQITEADAEDEGVEPLLIPPDGGSYPYIEGFRELFNSIYGPGAWNSNPWVWVIEFRRLS